MYFQEKYKNTNKRWSKEEEDELLSVLKCRKVTSSFKDKFSKKFGRSQKAISDKIFVIKSSDPERYNSYRVKKDTTLEDEHFETIKVSEDLHNKIKENLSKSNDSIFVMDFGEVFKDFIVELYFENSRLKFRIKKK